MDLSYIYNELKKHEKDGFAEFYKIGFEGEARFGCCGQCTILPFVELLKIDESIFKYASGFCAGIGQKGYYPCGAFNGGVMILSYFLGRDFINLLGDSETSKSFFRRTCKFARVYEERFTIKFGDVICKNVQKKIFGRSFDILDQENDYPLFEKMGAHKDKCTSVVGKAAQIVARLIYEELDGDT